MSRLRMLTALLALCLFSGALPSGSIHAATGEPPALSAAAQSAMDRGLAAAKQKKWDLAIKHFSAAQKEAPQNPEALFNLALAYDSAGGRELVAICWFHAYVESVPDAPNVEQVRKRILELEIAVEDNLRKMAKISREAVERLPDNDWSGLGNDRDKKPKIALLGRVAETYAIIGDARESHQIIEANLRYQESKGFIHTAETREHYESTFYESLAREQLWVEDVDGAKASKERIPLEEYRKRIDTAVKQNWRFYCGYPTPRADCWIQAAMGYAAKKPHDYSAPVFKGMRPVGYAPLAQADTVAFLAQVKKLHPTWAAEEIMDAIKEIVIELKKIRKFEAEKVRKFAGEEKK